MAADARHTPDPGEDAALHTSDAALRRLRGYRVRPGPELSLVGELEAQRRKLERQHRAGSGVAEAWGEVVPPELRAGIELLGMRQHVLRVRCADSGVRYRLDRWLRSGGLASLRAAARVPLDGVRAVR